MKQDIRTLSNNVTELVNNLVDTATSRVRTEGKPVYVSLMEAAPPDMSEYEVTQYIQFILDELSTRPEITDISFPRTAEECRIAEEIGPLSMVIGCNPLYCKNLFDYGLESEQGYIAPTRQVSMARKAEIADKAIVYIQENAEDVIGDLTERLGFSITELDAIGLFPEYQPLRIDYVVESIGPGTGKMQLTSYDTIEEALDEWDSKNNCQIYAETEWGSIALIGSQTSSGKPTCLSFTASLLGAGLLPEDLPEELVENLRSSLCILSKRFPTETGLPSKLTQENAVGQTMYYSEHCFYGEILNMEPVLCTGFKKGEEEYLDQLRIQREVTDCRGNPHDLKHVLLRSQILLNREDIMSEVIASRNWTTRDDRFSMLAVSKNIQTGHIFMLPLEAQMDEFDGTSKLRRWSQEYSIDNRAPKPGESLTQDGYQVFFFDIDDLEGAVDFTIALMRPYVSEIQQPKAPQRLCDLLACVMEQGKGNTPDHKDAEKHTHKKSVLSERG